MADSLMKYVALCINAPAQESAGAYARQHEIMALCTNGLRIVSTELGRAGGRRHVNRRRSVAV